MMTIYLRSCHKQLSMRLPVLRLRQQPDTGRDGYTFSSPVLLPSRDGPDHEQFVSQAADCGGEASGSPCVLGGLLVLSRTDRLKPVGHVNVLAHERHTRSLGLELDHRGEVLLPIAVADEALDYLVHQRGHGHRYLVLASRGKPEVKVLAQQLG